MTAHLDDRTLQAFAAGTLGPGATLAADDHLAGCPACTARAAALVHAAAAATAPSPESPAAHLTDEEIRTAATTPILGPAIRGHLDRCGACRQRVATLRSQAAPAAVPARRPIVAWLALALGLMAAMALGWLAFGVPTAQVAGLDLLDAASRIRVDAMLANGRVALPAVLDELSGSREAKEAGASRGTFAPIRPLGIVVAHDRPRFAWTRLAGARDYRVVILDAALARVAESPAVAATEWTPPTALPRGRTYGWQVRGGTAAGPVTTPAAPARFHVVDAATVTQLAAVEAGAPDAHLVLGLLSAEAGLLDDATRHLAQVDADEPHATLARDTLAAIEARRQRP